MKTVIQHAQNGRYLSSQGTWEPSENEAVSFKSSLEALDHCCRHKIWEAVLVLKFTDARFDIQLHPFENRKPPPPGKKE